MKKTGILLMNMLIILICTGFGFEQFEFMIGNEYPIPAALTLPKGKEHFPMIIIIQGSGDSGIDNVVGDNATIKDLAHGLSENAMATFRYAKRNGLYPGDFKRFTSETVEKEYLEDARMAMETVLKVPGIQDIYLLGVSMGGYLLPEIADLLETTFDIKIKGLICCASGIAGTPAPLVMFEQIRYQMKAGGYTEEQIRAAQKVWEDLSQKKLNENTVIHPNMTAGYVYRIMDSDPYSRLKKTTSQVLVIQGDADRINVARFFKEFQADFKVDHDDNPQFEFVLLPNINHRLMQKEYEDLYTDLLKKGVVDPQIIELIADWIKRNSRL